VTTGADLHAALVPVLDVLNKLGARHFVAGSIASSAHGVPRASIDADVVAEFSPDDASPLIDALMGRYYVPENRVREAIRERTSFSVIHLATMVKVDVFVARDQGDRQALDRTGVARLEGGIEVPVSSPEDTIAAKLWWYRKGGEVSERQWTDVIGLLRVATPIDKAYLSAAAGGRGVSDLLARAFEDASRR
jgi:hypothetical protein